MTEYKDTKFIEIGIHQGKNIAQRLILVRDIIHSLWILPYTKKILLDNIDNIVKLLQEAPLRIEE